MRIHHFIATSQHPVARAAKRAYWRLHAFSLPAPRAVVRPALWAYLGARSAYYFAKRVLVCEPLFKAYCTRYGRGVRTGVYVHWVQGRGVIALGDGVLVDGKCSFAFAASYSPDPTLEVGEHSLISHDCSFTIGRRITIGRHCLISRGVWMFDASGHPTDPAERLSGRPAPAEKVRPIVIGDNVWIGSRCLILPGTTIGEGSVVSAGSVVRGDVAPYSVVAGNPARVVASLPGRLDAVPSSPSGSMPSTARPVDVTAGTAAHD